MPYRIELDVVIEGHLARFSAREQRLIFDEIELQLRHQPGVETKNRKLLRPNPVAEWELRCGEIRIYYDLEPDKQLVTISAIGRKVRNRVFIGDKEFLV